LSRGKGAPRLKGIRAEAKKQREKEKRSETGSGSRKVAHRKKVRARERGIQYLGRGMITGGGDLLLAGS